MEQNSEVQNDNYTWLSVKETAGLLCKDESTVQKMCKNEKCITKKVPGKGRGGEIILIALESLAMDVQESFFTERELEENSFISSLTGAEREKLYFKYRVVMEYQGYKTASYREGRLNRFLSDFNSSNPDSCVTRSQVSRWESSYFNYGLKGLYDSRGTHTRGSTTVPDEVWDTFYSIWFNTKTSVQQCYEMACEKHKDLDNIPSISSFRRKLASIPQPVKVLRNKGKKALDDTCMPHMEIDYSVLSSNQQWVADHHVFDVLVEDEQGRIFRPWLSAWLDRRSRYIVGYEINPCEPNSDIVLSSFAKACNKSGIPDEVLLDNGKDFKVYDLFNNDNAMSIARQMGIKVTNAIVKNAKAKPIERYFKTLEEKYFSTLPCYIAGKPHLRPEKMGMTNRKLKLKGLCMKYSDFLELAGLVIKEMNNAKHHGKGMGGRTPYEVYTSNFLKPVRMVKNEDVLNLLFQRTSRPVKVGRNGIRVPAIGLYYDNDQLFEWVGKEVFARYNSDDISKVYVYSTDDRFICSARCNELAQLGTPASMELIREYNHRKKERRERLKNLLPDKDYYTLADFLNDRRGTYKEFDVKGENPVIQMVPVKYKHLEEIRKEEEEKGNGQAGENETAQAGEGNTVPYMKRRNKRDVDKAFYEFIRKAGGEI